MRRPFCLSSVYLLAVLALSAPFIAVEAPEVVEPVPEDTCDADAVDPELLGVWHRWEALAEGDRMRFYFFHEGGFGLYRYGKVGLTNTHSFDYRADGGHLELTFRKTGERQRVRYRIEEQDGRTWLVLDDDPREVGGARYFKAPAAATGAPCFDPAGDLPQTRGAPALADLSREPGSPAPALDLPRGPALADMSRETGSPAPLLAASDLPAEPGTPAMPELATAERIGGRLWGEEVRYATGGMGFSIYQLQPQAIDGRGVGWHHRGDYDEWTTETLTYRQRGDRLALSFPLRHDGLETAIAVRGSGDDRTLHLAEDPRDFWRAHTYRDMGPTFAGAVAPIACLPQ
ncbi:hypothetical protein [Nannocystis punicea]|uniref:Uncharacterized protein n=1 Tax=Nannocystis punicea TaxID=2995304 RepID=A0ABY7HF15_9BACT|nr:hypothetical protein [Nannocystis poenicansa]WAS97872.1 hypothetical protein O0S08_17155 [Nannocystis poenicansa]